MKKYIKNLLSINRKAFRFLHDAEGFDFEKPYFIAEQPGKFTANTVAKAVQTELNPAQCKIIVFVVPTVSSGREGLYFATLSGGRFDGTRKERARYWDYRTNDRAGDIDYCWGVGDFETLRKKQTEKIFIIAQDKAHTAAPTKKNIDNSARFTLINARKHGDGRGNTYIGEIDLKTTDGSGVHFEYKPYSICFGGEKKSAEIADFIDKSGYLLRPHRFDLISRAAKLRIDRAKNEADNACFSKETKELEALIEKTKVVLSDAVIGCKDSVEADAIASRMKSFTYALHYFADYEEKLISKQYASIGRINSDIECIKEKLNYCITGNK